ncbi:Protein kinase, AMP-activated, beta [Cichlidogyrus casuarinus]|uniref:5'-AMP-activated protein kinase subunit beta-1 n=1 Tax=Cichlidogyrus casuarinus TaxID=1844966 RepID=A0ABD2Q5W1_9PLAT
MGNTTSGKPRRGSADEPYFGGHIGFDSRRSHPDYDPNDDQDPNWMLGKKGYENLIDDVKDITLFDHKNANFFTTMSSSAASQAHADDTKNILVPTLFKWEGGGKDVYISGTFNQWKAKIPMVKSQKNFYTIIDLPLGEHQYKFIVDSHWKVDTKQKVTQVSMGKQQSNIIQVRETDADVHDALTYMESMNSTGNATPPGEYNQVVPSNPTAALQMTHQFAMAASNQSSESSSQKDAPSQLPTDLKKLLTPPSLPPQLLQVILNKDTNIQSDPNLLPQPNHVMVNHMYALSIKDGVMVLSAITRYRQKFVSTVLYKPI